MIFAVACRHKIPDDSRRTANTNLGMEIPQKYDNVGGKMTGGIEPRHSKPLFRKVLGLHSLRRADSVNASTLVEGARQSGEVPPTAPLFTLICGARRSSRSASSAKSSRLSYRHDKSREFKSRSHRCLGDVAGASMVHRWRCLAPEFSFDKMTAEPMAAHHELVQVGHIGMERRV